MCAFYWLLRMSNLVDFQVAMTEKKRKKKEKEREHYNVSLAKETLAK